jgi:ABC-type phosphate transport system substrate-binding protein
MRYGNYELVREIGRGGMGAVWEAHHVTLGTRVAIKFLGERHETSAAARARFDMEARAAAAVRSKHAVQIFDHGVSEDGLPFIVMELLEGESLEARLAKTRRLAPRETLSIVAQVCRALSRAHELGIVHRDLKPENVFLVRSPDEREEVAKVLDFGVAKMRASLDQSHQTQAGALLGTPLYMSPEQTRAAHDVDHRTDLWSMGVIVFQCLTGRLPFEGESIPALLMQINAAPLPLPSVVAPDLPRDLDAWMLRALDRNPANRFASAGELADALHVTFTRGPDGPVTIRPVAGPASVDFEDATTAAGRPESLRLRPPSTAGGATTSLVPGPTSSRGGVRASLAIAAVCCTALVVGLFAWGYSLRTPHGDAAHPASPLASAGAAPSAPKTVLRVCGSTSIGEKLMPALVEAYFRRLGADTVDRVAGERRSDVRVVASMSGSPSQVVDIDSEGSAQAFIGLGSSTCDIGMSSRAVDDDEVARLRAQGFGDARSPANEVVIALDGVAIVVHPSNPLRSIDTKTLARVLSGEIVDWQSAGGRPGPIHVLGRAASSGTYETVRHSVLGGRSVAAGARLFAGGSALVEAVLSDENAIGFTALDDVQRVRPLAISSDGSTALLPTPFTIASDEYLLSRRLYLYSSASNQAPCSRDFVGFVLGDAGQAVVRSSGFIDLGVTIADSARCAKGCPPAYARLSARAQRLSLTFDPSVDGEGYLAQKWDRFDAWRRDHPGSRLELVGFSNSSGGHAAAAKRSRELVAKISADLSARGVRADRTLPLGDAMPIASNASEQERPRNDRVEVWFTTMR